VIDAGRLGADTDTGTGADTRTGAVTDRGTSNDDGDAVIVALRAQITF
jgi:hypothetical protein